MPLELETKKIRIFNTGVGEDGKKLDAGSRDRHWLAQVGGLQFRLAHRFASATLDSLLVGAIRPAEPSTERVTFVQTFDMNGSHLQTATIKGMCRHDPDRRCEAFLENKCIETTPIGPGAFNFTIDQRHWIGPGKLDRLRFVLDPPGSGVESPGWLLVKFDTTRMTQITPGSPAVSQSPIDVFLEALGFRPRFEERQIVPVPIPISEADSSSVSSFFDLQVPFSSRIKQGTRIESIQCDVVRLVDGAVAPRIPGTPAREGFPDGRYFTTEVLSFKRAENANDVSVARVRVWFHDSRRTNLLDMWIRNLASLRRGKEILELLLDLRDETPEPVPTTPSEPANPGVVVVVRGGGGPDDGKQGIVV